jgi:hypothetical protein
VIGEFTLKSPLKDDLHVSTPITSFYSTLTLIHIGLKQTTVRHRHRIRESNELRKNMDVMVEAYEILSCRMDLAAKTSRKLKINA